MVTTIQTEALRDLRAQVSGSQSNVHKGGIHNWGLLLDDGEYINMIGAGCYYSMPSVGLNGKQVVSFYDYINYRTAANPAKNPPQWVRQNCLDARHWFTPSHAQSLQYTDYLLNKSPLAPAFVTKGAKTALRRGIVYNTDEPAQFVIAAAMWQRQIMEKREVVHTWNLLVKEGINRNLALLLMFLIQPHEEKKNAYRILRGSAGNHTPIRLGVCGEDMRKKAIQRFVRGERPVQVNLAPLKKNRSYKGVTRIWTDPTQPVEELYMFAAKPPCKTCTMKMKDPWTGDNIKKKVEYWTKSQVIATAKKWEKDLI